MLSFLVTSPNLDNLKYRQLGIKLQGGFRPTTSYPVLPDAFFIGHYHEDSQKWFDVGLIEPAKQIVDNQICVTGFYIVLNDNFPIYLDKTEIISEVVDILQESLPEGLDIFDLHNTQTYSFPSDHSREKYGQIRASIEQSIDIYAEFREVLRKDPADLKAIQPLLAAAPGLGAFNLTDNYLAELDSAKLLNGERVEICALTLLRAYDKVKNRSAAKYFLGRFLFTLTTFNHFLSPRFHLEETLPRLFVSPEALNLVQHQESLTYVLIYLCNHESFVKNYELIAKYIEKIERLENFVYQPEIVSRYTFGTTGNSRLALTTYLQLSQKLQPIRQEFQKSYYLYQSNFLKYYYALFVRRVFAKEVGLGQRWKLTWHGWKSGLAGKPGGKLWRIVVPLTLILSPFGFLIYDYQQIASNNPDVIIANSFLDGDLIAGIGLINTLALIFVGIPLFLIIKWVSQQIRKHTGLAKVLFTSILFFFFFGCRLGLYHADWGRFCNGVAKQS